MNSWSERIGQIRGDRVTDLPGLHEHTPVSGAIKQRPSDFIVEEIPLYELEGDGPHLYFELKKQNWTTNAVRRIIADHMDVRPGNIGYAGRKDRNSISVQRMSLEHADEDRLRSMDVEGVELRILGWHRNKLKPGHHAGNRFQIKVRELGDSSIDWSNRTSRLTSTGVPNYFGHQRFGRRGDSAELGEMLVRDRLQDFIKGFFGSPQPADPDAVYEARKCFEQGAFDEAQKTWPSDRIQATALDTYRESQSPGAVLSEIPRSRRRLFVSAFQSRCFNEQVGARIDHLDTVFKGDIAKKQDTGGMFVVENQDEEQPRAEAGEIHPTGSLPGTDTWQAEEMQGKLETQSMDKYGVTPEDFKRVSYLGASGTRRAMRIMPQEFTVRERTDGSGPYLNVRFRLRSGSYATVVLRELMGTSIAS